jgi:hypothetical protein
LPRPTNSPDPHDTLPQPEVNPLMNPLLAQNMGRWAEVYFTSPPEKRNEAILELLRELGDEASAQPEHLAAEQAVDQAAAQSAGLQNPAPSRAEDFPTSAPRLEHTKASISCPSCSEGNPWDQRFCGRCGASLHPGQIPESTAPEVFHLFSAQAADVRADDIGEGALETEPASSPDSDYQASHETQRQFSGDGPRLFAQYEPKLFTQHESVPYRYRVYVGAFLAILVCVLFYVAWRGTQAPLGNSHPLPQAAPAAATQPAALRQAAVPQAAPPQPAPQRAELPENSAQNHVQTAVPARPAEKLPTAAVPTDADRRQPSRSAALVEKSPNEHASAAPAQHSNGTEELATAESYLNGSRSRARDSSEAAQWLWKSVAKQNGTAALILSDLYLKGDGVPKNCDQARVLLGVAGRKNIAGAAERIRNLQAFGCQ